MRISQPAITPSTRASSGGTDMRIRRRRPGAHTVALGVVTAGAMLAAAACSSSPSGSGGSSSGTINGAGSTFAAPMYQQWAGQYHQSVNSKVQINYQAIGSGGGIAEFTQGVVDFGATDAPMSSTEQSAAQAGQGSVVLPIPMIIGGGAVHFNQTSVQQLGNDRTPPGEHLAGKDNQMKRPRDHK